MNRSLIVFWLVIFTLVNNAIASEDVPVMYNRQLNLQLAFFPAKAYHYICEIIFWTNKGNVNKLGITTASGKNIVLEISSIDVQEESNFNKYIAKVRVPKKWYEEVLAKDAIKTVHFQISGFANGQVASIDLPANMQKRFLSFNTSSPKSVIAFLGVPLQGTVEEYCQKMIAKGFKLKKTIPEFTELSGKFFDMYGYLYLRKHQNNSESIGEVSFWSENYPDLQRELKTSLIKKYGQPDEIRRNGLTYIWKLKNGCVVLDYRASLSGPSATICYRTLQYHAEMEEMDKEWERKQRQKEQEEQNRKANRDSLL